MIKKSGYQFSLVFSAFLILSGCGGSGSVGASAGSSAGGGGGGGGGVGSALVAWIAPVSRLNGDPISLSEIGGYTIYYGTSSGDLLNAVTVAGGGTNQRQITGLAPATYYFQVSAYDQQGIEGPRTSLASKVVQ